MDWERAHGDPPSLFLSTPGPSPHAWLCLYMFVCFWSPGSI